MGTALALPSLDHTNHNLPLDRHGGRANRDGAQARHHQESGIDSASVPVGAVAQPATLRVSRSVGTAKLKLLVVRLSEAFEKVWMDQAGELGLEIRWLDPAEPLTALPDAGAVIVAAGGEEREALAWLDRNEWPAALTVFVVGADPGRRIAASLVARGASDYLALPDDVEILGNALAAAVERRREARRREEDAQRKGMAPSFSEIVGESPALKEVLRRAERTLHHDGATTLIAGETGTGKELLARALHEGGPRVGEPFVPVNCSALPSHLIESELFGHERGAFTDAHASKPGLFEIADGGTLFLDEIGTVPLELQPKLLRVLDDKQVRRVGGTKIRKIDVRIIAATNENLQQSVDAGKFREDLYYRLNVITLTLPPLRERGDDVVLIAGHVLEHLSQRHGLPLPRLDAELRSRLLGHRWPGNIRELKNALERALWLSAPGCLDPKELVFASQPEGPAEGVLPFPADLNSIITAAARATLDRCGGNRSEAARQLMISRQRLARLLGDTA
ncbi:MAG: sigma 54-interacting transcriptional regulator [Gemmatimonadales bacterium]